MGDAILGDAGLIWGLSVRQSNGLLLLLMGCSVFFAIAFGVLALFHERYRKASKETILQYQADLKTLGDHALETQRSLQGQLDEVRSNLQTSQREKAEFETQGEALKQQCSRLRDGLETQAQQVQQDAQATAFQQIQTLLTQHPTVRRMAETKPDLPARNIVALFTSLDNLVQFWGYQAIGAPWEALAYDPQIHQADASDVEPGETVYVRFVGYRHGKSNQILVPAKVSRTLPSGMTPAPQATDADSRGL